MAIDNTHTAQQLNNVLHSYNVPKNVAHAIENASRRTGVDFTYLIEKAAAESSFKTDIKAKTSSATGLYQFIDSTWLQTVKKHGAKHGLKHLAEAITVQNGRFTVENAQMRQKILNERNNPRSASLMAAEFAADNKDYLESSLGHSNLGNTDLYLAHFLGAGGASQFLKAKAENGGQIAASLMPAAAKANRNVFYDKSGRARSLDDVYAFFSRKFKEKDPVQIAQEPEKPADIQHFMAQKTPHHVESIFQTPRIHQTNPWNHVVSRVTGNTRHDNLLESAMMGGGLLAPETTMYMAAMNIYEPSNEEEGASLWLKEDKKDDKNSPQKQNYHV